MIGIHGRRAVVTSDSSDDGSPQPRKRTRSNTTQSSNTQRFAQRQSNCVSNDRTPSVDSQNKRNVTDDTSSSESEDDEELFHPSRSGTLKPLSDYETGESSNRDIERLNALINALRNEQIARQSLSENVDEVDEVSSSDGSVICSGTIKRGKRPLSPISSSDSSDSGVPIGFRKAVKRTRLPSSSESSSSEESININDSNVASVNRDGSSEGRVDLPSSYTLRNQGIVQETEQINSMRYPFCNIRIALRSLRNDSQVRISVGQSEDGQDEDITSSLPNRYNYRGGRNQFVESEDETSPLSNNGRSVSGGRLRSIVIRTESGTGSTSNRLNVRRRIADLEIQDESDHLLGGHSARERRIPLGLVESEDESGLTSDNSHSARGRRNRGTLVQNENGTGSRSNRRVRRRTVEVEIHDESGPVSNSHSARERRIPTVENDYDNGPLFRGRRVRGRRLPVIESEDESGSVSNNDHSVRGRRMRHRENNTGYVSRMPNVRRGIAEVEIQEESGPVSDGHNARGRNPTVENNNDENGPVLRGRRVRGRRLPVVESEDEGNRESNNDHNVRGRRMRHRENNTGYVSRMPNVRRGVAEVEIQEESGPVSDGHNARGRNPTAENNDDENGPVLRGRRVRGRRIPVVETDDESSNNESGSEIRPRALANRRVIDNSSSYSSTDSDERTLNRNSRHRSHPVLNSEYGENDLEGFRGFEQDVETSTVSSVKVLCGNSSDSDGESEKCAICLARFKLQEVGKPTACDHKFCSLCIQEWAKNNNTCPVDRKAFFGIVVYTHLEGTVISELPVVKPSPSDHGSVDMGLFNIIEELYEISDDDTSWHFGSSDEDVLEEVCFVCNSSLHADLMISCDSCSNVYHMNCVNPPLQHIPVGNWFCPPCLADTDYTDSD